MAKKLFRTGETETARVEAFSDGVLAIVMTLLILDIRIPAFEAADDAAIWRALALLVPKVAAWIISFIFVLVFWVSHHYMFNALDKVDRGILWLNGLFLMFICFMPFPTALAGEHPLTTPPLALLSATMLGAALSFTAMRLYSARASGLMAPRQKQLAQAAFIRGLSAPALYACALLAAFFAPLLCVLLLAAVPIVFFFPPPERAE